MSRIPTFPMGDVLPPGARGARGRVPLGSLMCKQGFGLGGLKIIPDPCTAKGLENRCINLRGKNTSPRIRVSDCRSMVYLGPQWRPPSLEPANWYHLAARRGDLGSIVDGLPDFSEIKVWNDFPPTNRHECGEVPIEVALPSLIDDSADLFIWFCMSVRCFSKSWALVLQEFQGSLHALSWVIIWDKHG